MEPLRYLNGYFFRVRKKTFLAADSTGGARGMSFQISPRDADLELTTMNESSTDDNAALLLPVAADPDTCRICLSSSDAGKLFRPCRCKGTMAHVHGEEQQQEYGHPDSTDLNHPSIPVHCLQRWRVEKLHAPPYYRCDQVPPPHVPPPPPTSTHHPTPNKP